MAQKKATVFNPTTGERKVVTVGDPNAFAGGFVLETENDNLKARGRSLEGTLPPEEGSAYIPETIGGQDGISDNRERSLGGSKTSLSDLKNILRNIARNETPKESVSDIIDKYTKSDIALSPNGFSDALKISSQPKRIAEDVYNNALDMINESEKNKQMQAERGYDLYKMIYNNDETRAALKDLEPAVLSDWLNNGVIPVDFLAENADALTAIKPDDAGDTESWTKFDDNSLYNRKTGEIKRATKPVDGPVALTIGNGQVTAYGSDLWEHGLDFVLSGGPNAPVPSPFDGEVMFAGVNGGFGNKVKIKTPEGDEVWFSHLNELNVKKGDTVGTDTVLGLQGNTGSVLGADGSKLTDKEIQAGRGTHLDITMKKSDGSFYSAKEVAAKLGDTRDEDDVERTEDDERRTAIDFIDGEVDSYQSGEKDYNYFFGEIAQNTKNLADAEVAGILERAGIEKGDAVPMDYLTADTIYNEFYTKTGNYGGVASTEKQADLTTMFKEDIKEAGFDEFFGTRMGSEKDSFMKAFEDYTIAKRAEGLADNQIYSEILNIIETSDWEKLKK